MEIIVMMRKYMKNKLSNIDIEKESGEWRVSKK